MPVSPIINSSFTNEKVYHPAVEMQITDEDEQNNNDMWIQDLVFGMQDNIQEDSQQPQIDPSEIEEMLQQSQIEDSENADNPFFLLQIRFTMRIVWTFFRILVRRLMSCLISMRSKLDFLYYRKLKIWQI